MAQSGTRFKVSRMAAIIAVILGSLRVPTICVPALGSVRALARLVTRSAGPGRQCTFVDWDQELTPFAYVYCFSKAGSLASTAFTILWVVA